jgi:excisionase family DNA binding protein
VSIYNVYCPYERKEEDVKRHMYEDERLWTVTEVANELGVSAQAVYQWIREGQIDYVPYGRNEDRILVPESVVQKFAQRRAEVERLRARIRDERI